MVEPGAQPPAGVESNFKNPNMDMYYVSIITNVLALVGTTVFMALRIWARSRLSMGFKLDDVCCMIGYVGFVGYCTICLLMLRYGGGLHQWDVPKPLVSDYNKTVYATLVNYGPTVFAIKASILLFLTRVFAPFKTYVKWIYGFLGLLAVYYVTMLFLKTFICRPIPMFWGATTDGQCFNQRILILTDNVLSLLSDIVVLLIPCPMTRSLQVGLKAKLKIGAIFGVGGIACIFSLVRLVFIANEGESTDQTYVFVKINLTGIAECGIGLICACFPMMPALWNSIFRKEVPGYTSNSRSQFEMMNSSKMNSRRNRSRTTDPYDDGEESDENKLIIHGNGPGVTTKIQGGGDDDVETGSLGRHNSLRKPSFGESRIVRTVEVRQYEEK
ncbi:hypothetical protein F5Y15DRAFT_260733 [Xylariaceae sp. FL0016]|nr:hypothetical protein F5Y15DRAFT_260733 [Xylariaceae sp. FL0016]